jgi:DNA-binding response OmpR family regulator
MATRPTGARGAAESAHGLCLQHAGPFTFAQMASMRSTLAVGRFSGVAAAGLEAASRAAGVDFTRVDSIGEALTWAEQHEPHSLLVDGGNDALERICLEVRAQVRYALVPILALAHEVNELAFAEAFSCGGDDVVGLRNNAALTARLRRLPAAPWERPATSADKTALISASDRNRRIVLARVLGNAGYPIRFAVDLEETERFAQESSPRLVVIDTELEGVKELITRAAPRNPATLWIVSTAPRHMRQCHAWLRDLANATVTDSFAPPENIVFLANELGRGKGNDKRASRRLLYGTMVSFRCAGRDEDDFGLSYNVSAGGLYVRSLAPPVEDVVWLELRPPRTERLVRLEGRVRWRRGYGPSSMATVPPGFGIEIMDGSKADRDAWVAGYKSFAETIGE